MAKRGIPPAAGKSVYVSNLRALCGDPLLQPRRDDAPVLARLRSCNLPCIVVDDGSDAPTRRVLEQLAAQEPGLTLIRLTENAGKGAAVIRGLQAATAAGFSHAVQVDADGQHAIEDIPHCWLSRKRTRPR